MKTELLFLFLILLTGLILASFLGTNEGYSNHEKRDVSYNIFIDISNNTDSKSKKYSISYDNYNHYTKTTSSSLTLQNGLIFTDAIGDTLTVHTNSHGMQTLELRQPESSATMILNQNYKNPNLFNAPFGKVNATIVVDNNNQTAIHLKLQNGETIVFTQPGTNYTNPNVTSTQYYGSTGNTIPQSNYKLAYEVNKPLLSQHSQRPYDNTKSIYSYQQSQQLQQPQQSQQLQQQSQQHQQLQQPQYNGNYGTNNYGTNNYKPDNYKPDNYSNLPLGISKSKIPPGQEDAYILKSEIVPPVCPACSMTPSTSCPRQEQCPPCPACARCPEPSFECKKVPNYNAISADSLPMPVLADFSQFGM